MQRVTFPSAAHEKHSMVLATTVFAAHNAYLHGFYAEHERIALKVC